MPSSILKEKIRLIAKEISQRFFGRQYAIRGTTSLILQDLELKADDVDILCDKELAESLGAKYSESPKFKSYFGAL